MSLIPIFPGVRIVPRDEDYLDRKSGSRGEIFFDKDNQSLRIFDGANVGGTHILTPTNVAKQITSSGVATVTFSTTVARNAGDTANVYYYNGVENPELTLVVGYTYVFDQTDLTNLYFPNSNGTTLNQHPLNFSSDDANGELGSGTTYLNNVLYIIDGVTVNKTTYYEKFATATTRSVQITVTSNTPATLYIWCKNHSGMGNSITVAEPGAGGGGASLAVSDTAPSSPTQGDIWYNSTSAKLYVYVQDTDSSQWVQPAAPAPGTLLGLGIADGTNGQALKTDGAGNFSFGDVSSTFADLTGKPTTIAGYGITDALALGTSSTTALAGNTALYANSDVDTHLNQSNPTSGYVLSWNGSDYAWVANSSAAGGSTTQVQFNNAGAFNGDSDFTYNSTTNTLTVPNISSSLTSGLGVTNLTSASTITLTTTDGVRVTGAPFRLPSFTTTEKNALTSANGDMIYDTTLNKAQVYENGGWASLV
jgi:hypothetical protein|tara:strand:+ start:9491 stop:10924 length:1434 start_codon:yes stop_codon:yes gene_type:complete